MKIKPHNKLVSQSLSYTIDTSGRPFGKKDMLPESLRPIRSNTYILDSNANATSSNRPLRYVKKAPMTFNVMMDDQPSSLSLVLGNGRGSAGSNRSGNGVREDESAKRTTRVYNSKTNSPGIRKLFKMFTRPFC